MSSNDEDFDLAVDIVLVLMQSVPRGTIAGTDWWDRARAAIEAASNRAENWAQWCSIAARKLGIGSYRKEGSAFLTGLSERMVGEAFSALRRSCGPLESIYVVAAAQTKRALQREQEKSSEQTSRKD